MDASDSAFANSAAPNIQDIIAENGLDLAAARTVYQGTDGTAGLIPGTGVLGFVSSSTVLGTVSSCLRADWAEQHGGFGFVGAVGDKTLVQGLVPDGVTSVKLGDADGSTQDLALNSANAYSSIVQSTPSALMLYSGTELIRRTDLEQPKSS